RRPQPRCHVGGETEGAEQPATPTGTCTALLLCLIGAEGAVALALIDVLSPEIGAEARQVVRSERGQEIRARPGEGLLGGRLEFEDPGAQHVVSGHTSPDARGHGTEILTDDARTGAG